MFLFLCWFSENCIQVELKFKNGKCVVRRYHVMNFENVEVVGSKSNYHERLFLEAWHSTLDPNSGNDHILLPEVYKGIARAWVTWSRALASRHVTFTCVWQRTSLSFTDEGLRISRNVCYQLLRVSGKHFP